MALGVLIAVVVAVVLWAVVSYNSLVGQRNQVANGWRQIDVQLKRRHDLIPNLVNAVRGSMDFERDTLTAVMEARSKALTASGPADAAQKEGQLSQGIAFFVIWLIALLLAPFIAQTLAMMVSRRREYLADASGAELTRNPGGLARALEKIEAASAPTKVINRGTAHLCIADPLGRRVNLKEGFWSNLFASHPPMASRIAALREMAFQPPR